MKIISKKGCTEQIKKCTREEITIGSSLNHQNVVQIKEVFDNEHNVYIVMELVEGGDLRHYLKTYVLSHQ